MVCSHSTGPCRSESPVPSASRELLFSRNVCFCCKTKETLIRSTVHFTMYGILVMRLRCKVCTTSPRLTHLPGGQGLTQRERGGSTRPATDVCSSVPLTSGTPARGEGRHQKLHDSPALTQELSHVQEKWVSANRTEMKTLLTADSITLSQVCLESNTVIVQRK